MAKQKYTKVYRYYRGAESDKQIQYYEIIKKSSKGILIDSMGFGKILIPRELAKFNKSKECFVVPEWWYNELKDKSEI